MKDLNANTYVKYILKTSKSIGRVKWWKTKLSYKAKDFEVGSKNANIPIAAVQVKTKSSFSPSYLNFNTEQLQSVGFFSMASYKEYETLTSVRCFIIA